MNRYQNPHVLTPVVIPRRASVARRRQAPGLDLEDGPVGAFVDMSRVVRGLRESLGENDPRVQQAQRLYVGLGVGLLVVLAVVGVAKALDG